MIQHLFFDAKVTEKVENHWKTENDRAPEDVLARFVATNGGLTRVFPAE